MNQRKAIMSSYIGVVVMASIIFLAGGRLRYWQALLYLALALLGTTITHLLAPPDGDLAARRVANARAGEAWDRRLMGVYFLLTIASFVVAGLDSGRFGWTGALPLGVTIAGALLMVGGQLLFALARRENSFFTSTVQLETAHAVCSSGPYSIIRHPGYLGMAISLLAFPLVLGSLWAGIPVALALALLLWRVRLEDRFLAERLAGYHKYAGQVRYRLIPRVY